MVKPIAFYVPQYHRVPENDEWWGEGFTEWTNVRRAKPNWDGHYQPHVPRELGYYDLSNVDVMRQHAKLAQSYGIYGFCYYHFWFAGRTILEKPVQQLLKTPDIDMPFCVCWANENWTRTWDGLDKHVLLGQKHSPEDDAAFLNRLVPTFRDPRYIRVDSCPMLLVYRVDLFPDAKATAARWRKLAVEAGFAGLYLCAVQFHGLADPRPWGFDAAVEFPPHNFITGENRPDSDPGFTNPEFKGTVLDYVKVAAQSLAKPDVDYPWYRGVMPSWDNTARRQNTPHIFMNSSPYEYQYWLQRLVQQTERRNKADRQFLFINAWNEWGEGCHLEPDERFGLLHLEATRAALRQIAPENVIPSLPKPPPDARLFIERSLAHERSVFALSQILREKNLRITQLEAEVQGRRASQFKDVVWEAAKKEARRFPGAFDVLKGIRDRLRPRNG